LVDEKRSKERDISNMKELESTGGDCTLLPTLAELWRQIFFLGERQIHRPDASE
jgi:hypothetical protein